MARSRNEGRIPSTEPKAVGPDSVGIRRPPLPHQIGWTLVGNLSYAAAQWGILIVLAKIVPAADVGRFGLGLAIATPVLMLSNFQLRSLQATRASDLLHFPDYLGFRLLSSGLAMLGIVAVAVFSGYEVATTWVVVAVGFAKCVESIGDTVYGHLQGSELMDAIAKSMAMKGVLSLMALTLAMWIWRDVLFGVLALALAWLAVLVAYDLPNAGIAVTESGKVPVVGSGSPATLQIRPRLNAAVIAQICRLGLPLALASLFLALANNVPRYVLERWHGEEALGYFTALAYPTAAFSILLSAFGQAATPRLAYYYRSDSGAFARIVLMLGAIPIVTLAIILPVLFAFGPAILTWLYRVEYAQFFQVFLVLLVAGTVWSLASVLGYAATCSGKLSGQAPVSAAVCAVTLAVAVVLVPSGGLVGAAWVALVAGGATFAGYAILLLFGSSRPQVDAAMRLR